LAATLMSAELGAELGADDLPDTDPWLAYEVRKCAWLQEHPDASSAEYEFALKQICKEIGG